MRDFGALRPHQQKSQENVVFGNQEQAIPEGFRNLSRSARSGFGGRNEADRCRSPPPPSPPIIVLAAVWRNYCCNPSAIRVDRFLGPATFGKLHNCLLTPEIPREALNNMAR